MRLTKLNIDQQAVLREQGLHPEDWMLVNELPDKLIIATPDNRLRTVAYKRKRRGGRG